MCSLSSNKSSISVPRQCNCVFKEYKNFEQLNSLVQLVLRLAINIISSWHQSRENDEEEERKKEREVKAKDAEKKASESGPGTSSCKEDDDVELPKAEDTRQEKCDETEKDKEKSSDGGMTEEGRTESEKREEEEETKDGKGDGMEEVMNATEDGEDVAKEDARKMTRCRTPPEESSRRAEDEDWTLEEKQRLLHLVAKVFHMTFPLYSAHKQYYHGVTDVSRVSAGRLFHIQENTYRN